MMVRVKNLSKYQKGVLMIMVALILVFAAIYSKTISKVGFRYHTAILVPTQENGQTIYKGKLQGKNARFIVSEDKSVVFHYGDKTYGAYTMKEDSQAIPKEHDGAEQMTGVEIYNGNKLLFRGGVLEVENAYWLYNEDGTLENIGISIYTTNGIEYDENGEIIDRMEPSASTIFQLLNEPELTHKGTMSAWFLGLFICIINLVLILFAEELFRWNLAFQIRNAENAEPSDWEMAGRYIGWTGMVIMALIVFIMGLQ